MSVYVCNNYKRQQGNNQKIITMTNTTFETTIGRLRILPKEKEITFEDVKPLLKMFFTLVTLYAFHSLKNK